MMTRENDSRRKVACTIVDGALNGGGELRTSTGQMPHAGLCGATISLVCPTAQVTVVQVFDTDGEYAPAEKVLEGLQKAADTPADVLCLPWTISKTRMEEEFREACEAAAKSKILVAAWAPGVERPVPASFESVLGVTGASRGQPWDGLLSWADALDAVAVPFSASRGTALLSGLAAVFVSARGSVDGARFAASVRDFARREEESAKRPGPAVRPMDPLFDAYVRRLADGYSDFIGAWPG